MAYYRQVPFYRYSHDSTNLSLMEVCTKWSQWHEPWFTLSGWWICPCDSLNCWHDTMTLIIIEKPYNGKFASFKGDEFPYYSFSLYVTVMVSYPLNLNGWWRYLRWQTQIPSSANEDNLKIHQYKTYWYESNEQKSTCCRGRSFYKDLSEMARSP